MKKIPLKNCTRETDALCPDYRVGAYDRLEAHARELEREVMRLREQVRLYREGFDACMAWHVCTKEYIEHGLRVLNDDRSMIGEARYVEELAQLRSMWNAASHRTDPPPPV